MGIVVGERFEDYGNTTEYTVGKLSAYEMLSGDRVRLYLTEERGSQNVLLYTAVVPLSVMACFGRQCLSIAGEIHVMPEWAMDSMAKLAS
jgi:hypothetical protein